MAPSSNSRLSFGPFGSKSPELTQKPLLSASTRRASSHAALQFGKAIVSSRVDGLDDLNDDDDTSIGSDSDDGDSNDSATDADEDNDNESDGSDDTNQDDSDADDDEDEGAGAISDGDELVSDQDYDNSLTSDDQNLSALSNAALAHTMASNLKDILDDRVIKFKPAAEKPDSENTNATKSVPPPTQTWGRSGPSKAPSTSISAAETIHLTRSSNIPAPTVIKRKPLPDTSAQPVPKPARKPVATLAVAQANAQTPALASAKSSLPNIDIAPAFPPASIDTFAPTQASSQPPAPNAAAAEVKPATATAVKPDPLAPTPAAPYGYKFVKVKKPDGTMVKVRRPLKEGEEPPVTISSKSTSKSKNPEVAEKKLKSTSKKTKTAKDEVGDVPKEATKKPSTKKVAVASDVNDVGGSDKKPLKTTKSSKLKKVSTTDESTKTKNSPKAEKSPTAEKSPKVKKSVKTEKASKTRDSTATAKPLKTKKSPAVEKPSIKVQPDTGETLITPVANPAPIRKTQSNTKDRLEKDLGPLQEVRINERELEKGETLPLMDPVQQAQFERSERIARIAKIIIWTIAIMFPLFFMALRVAAAALNGHQVDQSYFSKAAAEAGVADPLTQAITFAASAWPIIFAAVVAQSLKMLAAYRVKRGVKMMTLEQLTSSHSVGGALKQPFLLRTFNWTTFGLLFLWLLSPLAGQAILRMSRPAPFFDYINTNVSYYSIITALKNGSLFTVDDNYWNIAEGTLYGGLSGYSYEVEFSLLTALMQGYSLGYANFQDIYTNPRIPLVNKDPNTFDFYNSTNGELFSSLLGWPFWVYNQSYADQSTNFTVSSRYYALNCSDRVIVSPDAEILARHNLWMGPTTFQVSAENSTQSLFTQPMYWNGTEYLPSNSTTKSANNTRSVNVTRTYMQPGPSGVFYIASPRNATYSTNESSLVINQVLYAECPYRSVRLDSFVNCHGIEQNSWCEVLNQTVIKSETKSTAMSLGYWFPSVLQQMSNTNDGLFSQLEKFINNPQYAAKQLHNYDRSKSLTVTNMVNLTRTQLSERLGLVINALWNIGLYDTAAFTGPDLQSWQTDSFPYQNITARADSASFTIYVVIWGWISCLIICSVLLTVAAAAAAIFETRTVGPDSLGFANTAIKKSVNTTKNMSTMNARERLRALQECEVMLHDAKPDAAVGKIQLGVKEEGLARLVKTRQYK